MTYGEDEEALELARRKVLRELARGAALRRCCRTPSRHPREASTVDDLIKATEDCLVGVVFFYSPTCPYCRMLEPMFEEAARILGDRMAFLKVNVAYAPQLAAMFHVMATPTLVAFRRGKEVDRMVGLPSPERFEALLLSLLESERCPIPEVAY